MGIGNLRQGRMVPSCMIVKAFVPAEHIAPTVGSFPLNKAKREVEDKKKCKEQSTVLKKIKKQLPDMKVSFYANTTMATLTVGMLTLRTDDGESFRIEGTRNGIPMDIVTSLLMWETLESAIETN